MYRIYEKIRETFQNGKPIKMVTNKHILHDVHATALTEMLNQLRLMSDISYGDYTAKMRRDECLGSEIKMEHHKFGESELKAHCVAAEKLGRHRAFAEAANMLEELLKEIKSEIA